MLVTTGPVQVLHRGPYSKPDDADPLRWGRSAGEHEGKAIEKLMVLDANGVVWDNLTLSPSINGEASVGATLEMRVEINREQVARVSAGGRSFVGTKDKWRVVAVKPVTAPKA